MVKAGVIQTLCIFHIFYSEISGIAAKSGYSLTWSVKHG